MNKVKFGELFEYKKKSKIKAGDGLKMNEGKYPFYTSSNVLSKSVNEFQFSNPSLIFGTGGMPSVHFCEEEYAVSTDCLVAQPKDISKIYVHYSYYFFTQNNMRVLQEGFKGAGLKHISRSYIDKIQIPLPPLKTQKQIASILDNAATLRDKTALLLKEYDLLAHAIFLEMFGDPVVNGKGWKIKKLIDVSNQITDGTHHSPKPVKEGFPYVTAKHIKKMSLDFDSKPTYVDKQAHEEIYSRCKPEYQDVFLIKDGATTGVACLNSFKEPISLLSSVGLIKPDKEVLNPVFLVFWFNHSGVKEQLIRKFMSGAAIKRYTISKMKKFKIIVPPINLQNQFAEKIALIEQQKALAKQELQESEDLFNCLLQKAFKGELVKNI